MRYLILTAAILLLPGCFQSEARATSSYDIRGTLNGQPVTLHVDGDAATITKSGVDPAAIADAARMAATAAVDGVKASIPGIAQIEAVMKAGDGTPGAGAAAGLAGTAGALALAISQMLAARQHKKDADEGWELAHANALKVPTDKEASA